MSLLETYGPHLPFLRRFARALTGSQSTGDTYVRTALEALAAGATEIDNSLPPRVALYQMFLGIWSTTGASLESRDDADGSAVEGRVRKLAPISRQAFLLSALEGLNHVEIGAIIRKSEAQVNELLDMANADIEQELSTNVLIIEDEPIIAADIEALVEDLGHTVDSIAATHTEAVKAALAKKPGLVLSDVQLADGSSGIDAVTDILEQFDVPVIFITAFPERLLTGERPEPTYLISKPFQVDNVKAAISQALFFHED